MNELHRLNLGLGSLPLLSDAETRSISPENPTGEKGGGAKAIPDETVPKHFAAALGRGWKVRPWIVLPAGTITTLAEIKGAGIIQHIWITTRDTVYRDAVLRFYWDGEAEASVEVPLGDFFCNGHGVRCNVASLPVAVNPWGGFNSYWQMPFRTGARITIENQRHEDSQEFFFEITYALTEVPENIGYFHAQWRRSVTPRSHPEHVILNGVRGQGHYVGTYLAWSQQCTGWWGEGEVKFYLDGDQEFPTICSTGTEDYFGGAWCFNDEGRGYSAPYNTPFLGLPLTQTVKGQIPLHGMYRWHVFDPIRFKTNLKATVQALSWWPNGKYQPLSEDIASVAYWYQTEPHASFPTLPAVHERFPR